ncbi:hypothetical protein E2C01_083361 [Portunus trituberculatus]|uniref:Uncharacterized protein n=1 Tax=Portunus trituberculatus TaxID=210409 RepID=A0A5B7J3A2_PORTR|nr:hypothetical protein [Portunus trituberculatus]
MHRTTLSQAEESLCSHEPASTRATEQRHFPNLHTEYKKVNQPYSEDQGSTGDREGGLNYADIKELCNTITTTTTVTTFEIDGAAMVVMARTPHGQTRTKPIEKEGGKNQGQRASPVPQFPAPG